jgi:ribosome recycling factor
MNEEAELLISELLEKMKKTIDNCDFELAVIRSNRANPNLVNRAIVEYYGVPTPIYQITTISVSDGSTLLIKPFDRSSLREIEKAINQLNIGLPVLSDGQTLRIVLPTLSGERRKELIKTVDKVCETAKVAIRNIRREYNELIKKVELPEDQEKDNLNLIQKHTDINIERIDKLAEFKKNEILKND